MFVQQGARESSLWCRAQPPTGSAGFDRARSTDSPNHTAPSNTKTATKRLAVGGSQQKEQWPDNPLLLPDAWHKLHINWMPWSTGSKVWVQIAASNEIKT